MARYGLFAYGEELYGVETADHQLSWALEIDWDGDGLWSGDNEAVKMSKLRVRRGRSNMMRADGNGLESIKTGEFSATINNLDGRYDPYNPDSPLFPNVVPGKKFRLRVKDNSTGTIYPVLAGRIKDIQPVNETYDRITISGVDGLDNLQNVTVRTALQENIDLEDALDLILDGAGWGTGASYRAIDATTDNLPYWWAAGGSAREEIEDLVWSAFGVFYISADGKATFIARNSTRVAPQIDISGADIRRGIARPQPWEVVRNVVEIFVNSRQVQATATLWDLKTTPQIAAGGSLALYAPYTYNGEEVPAKNVQQPTPTTEFLVNTVADGSGVNLTASCTATLTAYADTARIVVVNNSASTGFITLLKFRGDPIASMAEVVVADEDAASIAIYDRRRMTIDTTWMQQINTAVDIRDLALDLYAKARSFPRFKLINNPAKQFAPDLMDHLALDFPEERISGIYQLAEIEHEWIEPTGNAVETRWRCEPFQGIVDSYWIFTTQIGIDSYFGF